MKTKYFLFIPIILLTSLGHILYAHESSPKKLKAQASTSTGLLDLPKDIFIYKLMPIKGVREGLRGVCKKLHHLATKELPDTKIHLYNEKELFKYLEKPIHHRPILVLHFNLSEHILKYITYLSHPLDISGLIIDDNLNFDHLEGLTYFIKKIPRLETLNLRMCLPVEQFEEFISPILSNLKYIKNLSLDIDDYLDIDHYIEGEHIGFFERQNNYLYLKFFLKHFVSFQTIEKLKLGFGLDEDNSETEIAPPGDIVLTSFTNLLSNVPKLKTLIILDSIFEHDVLNFFKDIRPLSNIKKLGLGEYSSYDFTTLKNLCLNQKFPQLRYLSISSEILSQNNFQDYSFIPKEIENFLAPLKNLKSLRLELVSYSYIINFYTLAMTFPHLKKLQIAATGNNPSVESINKLLNPTLTDKNCNFNHIYDLSSSELEEIDIIIPKKYFQYASVDLETTNFLFYFVIQLPKMKKLKCNNCRINDEYISSIIFLIMAKKTPSEYKLKYISLKGNLITHQGVNQLLQHFRHTTSDDFIIDLKNNDIDKSKLDLTQIPSSIKL